MYKYIFLLLSLIGFWSCLQGQPNIINEPRDTAVCEFSQPCFSLTATGISLTYQWQVDSGTGFIDLINNGVYTGIDSAKFYIDSVSISMDSFLFRCVVSGASNPNDTSEIVMLTVLQAPQIDSQPIDVTICQLLDTSFSIQAIGDSLSYQWQIDTGGNFIDLTNSLTYSGVDSPTLEIFNIDDSLDNSMYRCIISGFCDEPDTSEITTLTVLRIPTVLSSPTDQNVCEGDNAIISFSAIGENISYQWQLDDGSGFIDLNNDANYSGVTTATLNINNVPISYDGYTYRCLLFGDCSPDTSTTTVTLSVFEYPTITPLPVVEIYAGEQVQLNPTVLNATSYSWDPALNVTNANSLDAIFQPLHTTTYTLTATNGPGCTATEDFIIRILDIEIATAFTPNQDGSNDTWEIKGIENYPSNILSIYNSQGILVYAANGYNNEWQGTFNGSPLPMEVYYYVLDLNVENVEIYEGNITLIR